MAYRAIPGTRPEGDGEHKKKVPCKRCGVMRTAEASRKSRSGKPIRPTGLCRDCLEGMPLKEREEWRQA